MQWGGEADLLLFKYLLKTHDVKVDYKVLAEAMGNGITPKAITHRIAKIRSLAPLGGEGDAITPNPTPTKAKTTPKKAATPRTPKAKAAKGKKRSAAAIEDSDLDDAVVQDDEGGSQKSTPKKIKLGEKLSSSDEHDDKDDQGGVTVQVEI